MKLKFPIPILLFKSWPWTSDLKLLGFMDIGASLVAFLVYILLHLLPTAVSREYFTAASSALVPTFDTGMAFIEISFLIYAATSGICVLISLKKNMFDLKMCMTVIISEVVGVCFHITGVLMISSWNTVLTLEIWRLSSIDPKTNVIILQPQPVLTAPNLVLTFLFLFTYKAYWCYLIVYIHAISTDSVYQNSHQNPDLPKPTGTFPSSAMTMSTTTVDEGHAHKHHHKSHKTEEDDPPDGQHQHKHKKKHSLDAEELFNDEFSVVEEPKRKHHHHSDDPPTLDDNESKQDHQSSHGHHKHAGKSGHHKKHKSTSEGKHKKKH